MLLQIVCHDHDLRYEALLVACNKRALWIPGKWNSKCVLTFEYNIKESRLSHFTPRDTVSDSRRLLEWLPLCNEPVACTSCL